MFVCHILVFMVVLVYVSFIFRGSSEVCLSFELVQQMTNLAPHMDHWGHLQSAQRYWAPHGLPWSQR